MAKSDNLRKAKETKNDEFYTHLDDIENEISKHKDYVRQFEGKTVFCNCDDPEWSNFFVFFKLHFKQLKLKKLITTHFNHDGSPSYKIEWEGEMLNDDMVNLIKTPLEGNGDFRSDECIDILKEADIIVTNPPFSLWREYVEMIEKYKKQWIIIGNKNAIAYKEFFPLLKEGKAFVGYNASKGTMYFANTVDEKTGKIGPFVKSVPSYWYTNFDLDKTHEPIILTKNYYGNESRYPKYDNYDAIECGKVKEIPKDYFPCWYQCPHASSCVYAQTEGKENNALCEQESNFVFNLSSNDSSQNVQVEREREDSLSSKTLQQNCHSQNAVSVTELLVSRLLSSLNSVQSNSKLLDPEPVIEQKNSEYKGITEVEPICRLQETENNHVHTTESLFKDCKKCNGLIGVPITFLNDYCCDQFSIKGYSEAGNNDCTKFYKNMHLCQPLNGGDKPNSKSARYAPMLPFKPNNNENYYTADNAIYKMKKVYTRIFIQRKPVKE